MWWFPHTFAIYHHRHRRVASSWKNRITKEISQTWALVHHRLFRAVVPIFFLFSLFIMPRLETDIKLDFKDVLIRPKRSTLKSRSQVSLERTYNFRNSKRTWTGIPIMAANM